MPDIPELLGRIRTIGDADELTDLVADLMAQRNTELLRKIRDGIHALTPTPTRQVLVVMTAKLIDRYLTTLEQEKLVQKVADEPTWLNILSLLDQHPTLSLATIGNLCAGPKAAEPTYVQLIEATTTPIVAAMTKSALLERMLSAGGGNVYALTALGRKIHRLCKPTPLPPAHTEEQPSA